MRILVSGSLAYDRIMTFPGRFADHILPEKIHILNVCFLINGLTEKFGGTAGNIAYSLALLGEKPDILACAGNDFESYRVWFEKLGLPLDCVRLIEEERTAGAYITTDLSDNQITGFHPAAMSHSSQFDFSTVNPAETIAIVAPGNLGDMKNYIEAYKKLGVRCIFDPGQNITAFSGEDLAAMLSGASFLISNDYELEMIMNATGLSKPELLKRVPVIVTTLGEKGSLINQNGDEIKIAPAKVKEAKDPTGAGDAFRSGFIKGLCLGKSLAEAAQMGSVASAYAVEQSGTQEHSYSMDEFWKRYQENFG